MCHLVDIPKRPIFQQQTSESLIPVWMEGFVDIDDRILSNSNETHARAT